MPSWSSAILWVRLSQWHNVHKCRAAVLTAVAKCLASWRLCPTCSMQITQELREYAQKHDFDEEQAMQVNMFLLY